MSRQSELIRLVRQAAGTHKSDFLEYFIADVVSVDKENLVCSVTPVSDRHSMYGTQSDSINFSSIDTQTVNYTEDGVNYTVSPGGYYTPIDSNQTSKDGKNLSQKWIENKGVLTIDNVSLMSGGVSQGMVTFPIVGSQVTVLRCAMQQPLIIQYSEVESYQVKIESSTLTINNTGVVATTPNGKSQIILNDNPNGINLSVDNNGTSYTQTDKFILDNTTKGTTYTQSDKFSLKNAGGESLYSILNDLLTQLQALTVTCASPGSPSTVPVNTPALAAIQVRIANLLN
jgi:hypothetical protein